MCHSATQVCLYFIGGLYSFFVAQSFGALALLIMTSVQGRGYFQHTNTIIQTQPSKQMSRVCVYLRSEGRVKVSKVYESSTKVEWEGSRKQTERREKKDGHK